MKMNFFMHENEVYVLFFLHHTWISKLVHPMSTSLYKMIFSKNNFKRALIFIEWNHEYSTSFTATIV